ncbi:hypothetical protein EDD16DRAFT_1690905 [Pisolithus croceorrhizus]|nr:hypothetical protein EDD16DRAFT_1690905 [Pisolithus croceorrhizus]KAI6138693.1 hypothetical protein EDD17DRAFT_1782708 [Pisolithus thermaeus]
MPGPALPPGNTLPLWIQQHPCSHEIESAYNICLDLERWIQREADLGVEMEKAMICCRILGYLFHHFPSRDIKPFVGEIVTTGGQPEELLKLGEHFYAYLVKLYMSYKGITPAPSSHSSRWSVDNLVGKIETELNGAPPNHQTAKKLALIRDGFQCVVTKVYDNCIASSNRTLEQAVIDGAPKGITQCAHIFPESIINKIESGSNKENYATTVWAVLDRFGYRDLRQDLSGASIHRLDNVMTMDIYFTATEVPNRYKLEAIRDYFLANRPRYVSFSTPDAEEYPLPNRTYLAIHATCAKVAHLSGAAEHIEEVLERMEDTRVLAEDGGSSEVLYTAILSSMHVL